MASTRVCYGACCAPTVCEAAALPLSRVASVSSSVGENNNCLPLLLGQWEDQMSRRMHENHPLYPIIQQAGAQKSAWPHLKQGLSAPYTTNSASKHLEGCFDLAGRGRWGFRRLLLSLPCEWIPPGVGTRTAAGLSTWIIFILLAAPGWRWQASCVSRLLVPLGMAFILKEAVTMNPQGRRVCFCI